MYTIYLITNTVNGKVYVGQTIRSLKSRWKGHLQDFRDGAEQPLYRAIRKYGQDKFSIETLLTVDTKEEARYQERLWILLLRAHVSQGGYVCTWGGDGRTGVNDETRFKRINSLRKTLAKEPGRHPRYRDDIKDEDLIHLYVDEKLTRKQISEQLNFSQSSITVRLRKYGIKVGQGRHATGWIHPNPNFLATISKSGPDSPNYKSDLDTTEMVRLFEEGFSSKQIAGKLGCSDAGVRRRLEKINMFFPEKKFLPDSSLNTDVMVSLYSEGFTLKQVGQKLGCTGSAVRYRLKRIGMELRPSNNISRKAA